VAATSAATNPAGTVAVTPMAGLRIVEATSATSPNIDYVTLSSSTGASLTALPAFNLVLSTAAVGTYQEAEFINGKWNNVATASSNTTSGVGATSVFFASVKGAITIPAGGSVFLAFYQGNFPGATPSGQIVNTAIGDPGFEGTAAALGSPVTATGWTACTITKTATGDSLPGTRPFSSFTPTPGSTPGAFIEAVNTTVPQGTATPAPTVTAVPVEAGKQAAVFGGVFNNFNQADFAFNGLCTQVKVPTNPIAELSVWANGTENSLAFLGFEVNVLDTTGAFQANLVDENQIAVTPPGDTGFRQITLPSSGLTPFAGQTVQLFVGIWTKAGSSTGSNAFSGYYFVDDFNMAAGS
jgi:hypothetical protein